MSNSLERFKEERTRFDETTSSWGKHIIRAYKSYMEEFRKRGEKTLNAGELKAAMIKAFGLPRQNETGDDIYDGVRIFYDEEYVEEFDKYHGIPKKEVSEQTPGLGEKLGHNSAI